MRIQIPHNAQVLLDALEAQGFEAFVVGGCVRDALLGRVPNDWDICTNALPQQTKDVANGAGFSTFDTGIAHGTVTVHVDHEPFEVTTYRADGSYSDGRHPDAVSFLSSIEGDLQRRDFTMNAMAYSPSRGLVDTTGGAADLEAGVIRCVGDAHRRFEEDGLRIMRAVRFASVFGFSLEPQTSAAVHEDRKLLERISRERICAELLKLLCGPSVADVLLEYKDVIAAAVPQVEPMFGLEQHNPYHCYDVWEHCVRACEAIEPDPVLRLAALVHDIGKPSCFFLDEGGIGHFYGHDKAGAPIASQVCRQLKLPKAVCKEVEDLVRYHDARFEPTPKAIRRRIARLGEERMRRLHKLMHADLLAHSDHCRQQNLANLEKMECVFEEELASMSAFSVRDLAVGGVDLISECGFAPGPALGEALDKLFGAVVDGDLPNEREALLAAAREQ